MMLASRLLSISSVILSIGILSSSYVFPAQPAAPQLEEPLARFDRAMGNLIANMRTLMVEQEHATRIVNGAAALAHNANGRSIESFERANQSLNLANEATTRTNNLQDQLAGAEQRAQTTTANLEQVYNRLSAALTEDAARTAQARENQNAINQEHNIQLERTRIDEMHQRGIYAENARIQAQGHVEAETVKWSNIRTMVDDPKNIIKIVLAITTIALGIYTIKYGMPKLMNYLTQPRVVSETSTTGWFGRGRSKQDININDLIFEPSLQNKLSELVLRIQTAKMYDENLPNLLFYGPPGTGKTAFAKALSYQSGLDYALTSGSEFAKIVDLSVANDELRHLLNWAKKSSGGLIVFIDEAESLFANKKLPTTPKSAQDFINTFLSLVPEKSQKDVMFIFATNHPFKLDDAITNRIGISIEFTLPKTLEREKILATYLKKFAEENESVFVDLHPEIKQSFAKYAELLEGLSPRAIKFIAEEMITKARRQPSKQLTSDIAQSILTEAVRCLQDENRWKEERDQWLQELISHKI